jgi:hypothetical protein
MTQYDLIFDIVKSDYFIHHVGNVFTEIGTSSKQNEILKFIKTDFPDSIAKEKTLLEIYRNIQFPCWEKSNLYFFFGKLNALNCNLKEKYKVNLFVSGERDPLRGEINSKEDLERFNKNDSIDRDVVMAWNITRVFDSIQKSRAPRKKCLVIMNYRHAFSKPISNVIDHYPNITNVANLLFNHYGSKAANVYLNSLAFTAEVDDTSKNIKYRDFKQTPIQKGKWDASFKISDKENLGFDFRNCPFGDDSLDIWLWSKQYRYKDIFTGFVYYLPLDKHVEAFGIPHYLDNGFEDELFKRLTIFIEVYGGGKVVKEELKKEFNYSESKYEGITDFDIEINKWIKR